MLASRPLAAVGGQSLRQPLVQHPDIAFTQGVDEGRGIRTAVKHLAAFGIQGVYLDIEGVLEYPDDIHNGQFLSLRTYSECFFCCTLVEKGRGNGTSWAELVIFAA